MDLVTRNKGVLTEAVNRNKELLNTLREDQREDFKNSFIELASNDFLVSKIQPNELIKFCIDLAKLGVDVAASSRQGYVLPFNTKVGSANVMLPQYVFSDNGLKQQAYIRGFMLKIDPVFNISGVAIPKSQMKLQDQVLVKEVDIDWINQNMFGYSVILTDLKGELPEQVEFVSLDYCKEVQNSTLKSPKMMIQNYKHKAVRRAWKEFLIPANRGKDTFMEVENKNDTITVSEVKDTPKSAEKKPMKLVDDEPIVADAVTGEVIDERVDKKTDLVKDIEGIYKKSDSKDREVILPILKEHKDFRNYNYEKLVTLKTEINEALMW